MMRRWIVLSLFPLSLAAADTNSVPKAGNSFDPFQIIAQRNIFNPNRSARGSSRRDSSEDSKPARVDSFSLVGTMLYEKGQFAFFDSSSSDYRKVLKPGDSIAGYKLSEVGSSGVKLEGKDKTLDVAVGQQLRREDEGDWKVTGKPSGETAAKAGGSESTSTSSSSSGDDDDIVKKLMKKREEEMNK